jgi:antitoxin MazE
MTAVGRTLPLAYGACRPIPVFRTSSQKFSEPDIRSPSHRGAKTADRQVVFSAALTCIDQCIYWLIHRRFILAKTATLRLQQWGNSLAVRIPSAVAKSVGFKVGQPVEVSAQESAVLVTALGEPRLTLAQKLALFDLERHAGEAMATTPVGSEVL